MKQQINPRPFVLAAIILAAGLFRLLTASGTLTPLSNFTPLGAMALFGGCYYQNKWKAYLMPLLTLWLTDIILNRFLFFHEWVFFYSGFAWVYASFALMVLIGHYIKRVSVKSVLISAIAGAGPFSFVAAAPYVAHAKSIPEPFRTNRRRCDRCH